MTSAQRARVARGVAHVQADLDRQISLQTAIDNLTYLVPSRGQRRRPGQLTMGDVAVIRSKFERERNMAGSGKKVHIGDVLVHVGEPSGGNPYRGHSLIGDERVRALTAFKRGQDTAGYTFWFAPFGGGARRITADEVDWSSSRIGSNRTGANFVLSTGRRAKSRVGAHRATRTRRHLGASVSSAGLNRAKTLDLVSTKPADFGVDDAGNRYQVVYVGTPRPTANKWDEVWYTTKNGDAIRGPVDRGSAVNRAVMETGYTDPMSRAAYEHPRGVYANRAGFGTGQLTCDMERDCSAPVTHVDAGGAVYCTRHAAQRKGGYGQMRVRKLRPSEITKLSRGETIRYNRAGGSTSHRENENGLTFSRWLDAAGGSAHVDRVAPGAAFKAWRAGEDPSDYRADRNRAGRSSEVWYVVGYNYPMGHRDRRIKYQGGTFPTREAGKEAMCEGRKGGFYMHVTRQRPKGWYEPAAA